MKKFIWKIVGHGNINLIFLSGWGFNSKIWLFVIKKLSCFYKCHLVDFPGTGQNYYLNNLNLDEIIKILNYYMPKKSIWIGWSIGGLISTYFAILNQKNVLAMVTISSSPCFIQKKQWPGIKKTKIYHFYNDLKENYYHTINNFLSLQMVQSKKYFYDIIQLQKIFLYEKKPNTQTLKHGLNILNHMDLRSEISSLKIPCLRIYGSLDCLVPQKISKILDKVWPNSKSIIIKQAGHIPFVSHKKTFFKTLLKFIQNIYYKPQKILGL